MLISIIIVSHYRREFLMGALDSVLKQSLSRSNFEIIIVKNFPDAIIDEKIRDAGCKNILSNDESLGGKLSEAIRACEGEIICFLEDDDLFHVDKLATVYKKFTTLTNLGYYHNDFFEIDSNGRENIIEKYFHPLSSFDSVGKNISDNLMMEYERALIMGYLSTISVRRNVLENISHMLPGLNQYIDTYLFLSNYVQGGRVLADTKKLTYYRIHQSSSFLMDLDYASFMKKIVSNSIDSVKTFHAMETLQLSPPLYNYVFAKLVEANITLGLFMRNPLERVKMSDRVFLMCYSLRYRYSQSFWLVSQTLTIVLFSLISSSIHLNLSKLFYVLFNRRTKIGHLP